MVYRLNPPRNGEGDRREAVVEGALRHRCGQPWAPSTSLWLVPLSVSERIS
jgi:hypothetical protein